MIKPAATTAAAEPSTSLITCARALRSFSEVAPDSTMYVAMLAIPPTSGNAEHDRAVDRMRRDHPADGLYHDPHGQRQQREAVGVCRKRLVAAVAVRAVGAGDALPEPDRDDAEQQRCAVREHVRGFGEQRDRVRPESADGFDYGEQKQQHERAAKPVFAGVLRVVVRVAVTVRVVAAVRVIVRFSVW